MEFINKNIRFLNLLVLPVYFFIVQNSIVNKHTHFYANGIVITHSHPFDKKSGEPINKHNHTKTEICFFQCSNFDWFESTQNLYVNFQIPEIKITYNIANNYTIYCPPELSKNTRGPPFQF